MLQDTLPVLQREIISRDSFLGRIRHAGPWNPHGCGKNQDEELSHHRACSGRYISAYSAPCETITRDPRRVELETRYHFFCDRLVFLSDISQCFSLSWVLTSPYICSLVSTSRILFPLILTSSYNCPGGTTSLYIYPVGYDIAI